MQTHTNSCTHLYIHTYIQTRTQPNMCAHSHSHKHSYTYTYTVTFLHTYTHTLTHTHMHSQTYTYINTYTHKHTHFCFVFILFVPIALFIYFFPVFVTIPTFYVQRKKHCRCLTQAMQACFVCCVSYHILLWCGQPVLCGVGRSGSGRITPTAASTPIHSFLVTPDSPQPSHQVV